MLDPGLYRARIVGYGLIPSARKHTPTFFLEIELLHGIVPRNGDAIPCERTTRSYYRSITDETIDWLTADLRAIGVEVDSFEQLDPESLGAVNLFDREIDVRCTHVMFESQFRERWSIVHEKPRQRLGAGQLRTLDDRFGARLRWAAKDGATPGMVEPAPSPSPAQPHE